MTLIKLKDVNVDNIIDDIEDYSVWTGTFADNTNKTMNNFTLELEDGRKVELDSIDFVPYSEPFGIDNPTTFIMDVLRLVTSGEARSYTLADFIRWIVDNFVSGGIEITLHSKNGVSKGYIERSEYSGISYIDEYVKKLINSQVKYNDRFDYCYLLGETQDLKPTINDVLQVNLTRDPELSSVTLTDLDTFLSA